LKHGIPCVFFIASDWIDNKRAFYRNKVSLLIERLMRMEGEGRGQEGLMLLNRVLARQWEQMRSAKNDLLRLTRADEQALDRLCDAVEVDLTGFLRDRRPYLSTEQIQQMASEGFVIGAHSRSHAPLSQLDFEAAKTEVLDSVRIVREVSGTRETPFSFPFSSRGLDIARFCALRRNNPSLGLFFDSGGLRIRQSPVVNRIWAEGGRNGGTPSVASLPRTLKRAYIRAVEDLFRLGGTIGNDQSTV
jgi:peptidoglycan/xylan/chitin deacetylase (PgdA/CDA1 family)